MISTDTMIGLGAATLFVCALAAFCTALAPARLRRKR
jgi:hypothetical protein